MLALLKSDPITTILGFLGSLATGVERAPGWAVATTGGKLLIIVEVALPLIFGMFAADTK